MKIPFGKHSGTEVRDLPVSYLRWLNENDLRCMTPELKHAVREALREAQQRQESAWERFTRDQFTPPPRAPAGMTTVLVPVARLALMQELIECGFKALAVKIHPDKGGEVGRMQELNELRSALKAQIG